MAGVRRKIVASALTILSVPGAAQASGFAVRENNSADIAMASAGAASRADTVATAFANPAGLTYLKGIQADFGVTLFIPSVYFHGSASDITGPVAGNNSHDAARHAAIPHLYAKFDVTDALKLGLAVTVPFGNMVKYDSQWFGRYTPGGIETALASADINPSLAYKISPRLSIGAGVSLQWLQGTFVNALNQSVLVSTPGLPDGGARFKGDDWAVGYNVGILAEPWEGTRIGLTYRSKVNHQLEGNIVFTSIVGPLQSVFPTQRANVDISLPASSTFSVTHTLTPKLDLSAELQWTQWSTFATSDLYGAAGLAIPTIQRYRNSVFGSIGAVYHLTPALDLRGGIGYDQSPVTNGYRTVGVPDQDRYMVALGISYKLKGALSLDAAYAHYFAEKASMNQSVNASDAFGLTTLNGTYTLALDFVSVDLRYKF